MVNAEGVVLVFKPSGDASTTAVVEKEGERGLKHATDKSIQARAEQLVTRWECADDFHIIDNGRTVLVRQIAQQLAAEAQAAIQCPLHHIPMTACQEEVKRFEQAAAQTAKQEERERCISAMSELHTEECRPIGGILRRCCCRVGEIVAQLRSAPLVTKESQE